MLAFSHLSFVVVHGVGFIEAVHARVQSLSFLDGHAETGGLHLGDVALDDPQPLRV